MKYLVAVEAVKLDWNTWEEICNFVSPAAFGKGVWVRKNSSEYSDNPFKDENLTDQRIGLILHTFEGDHLAVQGDFIIKGAYGEFYANSPDIFEKNHKKVETDK